MIPILADLIMAHNSFISVFLYIAQKISNPSDKENSIFNRFLNESLFIFTCNPLLSYTTMIITSMQRHADISRPTAISLFL